jgi:hypothetical protein
MKRKLGRPKTEDKFAEVTDARSPLGVGLRIERLMRQGTTYDQVLIFFKEILPPDYQLSKNTVDKYRALYQQTICEPARAAGRDEEEFWKEFVANKSAKGVREWDARHRDQITVEIRSPLSTEELAAALTNIATNEAARVRKQSIDADYLTITFDYRAPKKRKKC